MIIFTDRLGFFLFKDTPSLSWALPASVQPRSRGLGRQWSWEGGHTRGRWWVCHPARALSPCLWPVHLLLRWGEVIFFPWVPFGVPGSLHLLCFLDHFAFPSGHELTKGTGAGQTLAKRGGFLRGRAASRTGLQCSAGQCGLPRINRSFSCSGSEVWRHCHLNSLISNC